MQAKALCATMALIAFPAITFATPTEYSFELTLTELRTGTRPDPYYSQFHVGQQFYGTFTYDPSMAVEGVRGYQNTTSLAVQIADNLVTTRYGYTDSFPGVFPGTFIQVNDGAAGGTDSYFMFEEVPLVHSGYLADYQAEQFYINLSDSDGTAVTGNVPGPIDFTLFDSGQWNFWSWGNEALYSSLLMNGTVGNIREVPTPVPLGLAVLGIAAVFVRTWLGRAKA